MHDNYSKYVKWFCTPQNERNPKTLEELMSLLEISQDELLGYTERPSFYEDLKRESRNWGFSKMPELIHIAYKTAKEGGKPLALKVFKEMLEDDKGAGGNINIINISPESTQYKQIVEREARRFKPAALDLNVLAPDIVEEARQLVIVSNLK